MHNKQLNNDCRGDFTTIFMGWGFCEGKTPVDDLGTRFHMGDDLGALGELENHMPLLRGT